MVIILPLWFPLLVLYVVIDPVYHVNLWANRWRESCAVQPKVEVRYGTEKKINHGHAAVMILSPKTALRLE